MKRFFALILTAVMLLAVVPFSASAANSYWGFDDYDTIENPNAPAEITSYPTTITKNNASSYTISCETDAGKLSLTLVEETWGTFNLGSWKLVDKNNRTHVFVDGSTDMEYVHQLYYSDSEVTWSGGNHGGEALVSLKFYDGETGNEIVLSNGGSKTVNLLHVIENTELLLFPDLDNDSINDYINKNTAYTDDQVYAQLTRKYTIAGPMIKLNVDYKYLRDTYHARNYSCMFPINKTYGQYCDMFDKDGNRINTISTVPYGDTTYAPYCGPHNQGNAATRAVVYSENSPYIFDMRINTFKDSVNEFKNANYKTSFWDMNYYYNKLYFTRFDEGKKVLHAKDSEVHTECIWMFTYDEDGRAPEQEEDPISLDKNYSVSVTNAPIVDPEWNVNYGAFLTDGKAAETFDASNASWFAIWVGKNSSSAGVGTITVDLEKEYNISKIKLHLANAKTVMGVTAPKSAKAYTADANGNIISEIGTFTLDTSDDVVYWTELKVNDVAARYVMIELSVNSPCAYINEISIYGSDESSNTSTDGEATDNLLSDLNYEISYTDEPMGAPEWGTAYGALLTDGAAAKGFNASDNSWFFFQKGENASVAGVGTVTIELGAYYDVTKSRIHLANVGTNMGIYAPESIKLYGSLDGEKYDIIGEFALDESDTIVYWSELTPSSDVNTTVKFVKFEFTANSGSLGCYVNELELYGSESDYTPDPDDPPVDYIAGDVNADGVVDMFDYLIVKGIYFEKYDYTEDEFKRADCNSDGVVDMFDYLEVKTAYFTSDN